MIKKECKTYSAYCRKMKIVIGIIVILGAGMIFAASILFSQDFLNRPAYDKNAESGVPKPGENFGYSPVAVNKDCTFMLCGLPANREKEVDFYLTNDKSSTSLIRGELQTETGTVLGETGVIRPGEYVRSITLNRELEERETKVKLKVISYAPGTWQSRGTVSLELTIYKGYDG